MTFSSAEKRAPVNSERQSEIVSLLRKDGKAVQEAFASKFAALSVRFAFFNTEDYEGADISKPFDHEGREGFNPFAKFFTQEGKAFYMPSIKAYAHSGRKSIGIVMDLAVAALIARGIWIWGGHRIAG